MNPPASKSAVLLFAHGSSEPGWAAPFVQLKTAVQARSPGTRVELAFLERMHPSFDEVVAALHSDGIMHITVAPIFLALGGHLRSDLPKLIEASHLRTSIEFTVLPALGEVDELIAAIADWVSASTN